MSRLDDAISDVPYILDTLCAYRNIAQAGNCNDCVLNDYCLNIPSRESCKAAIMSVDKCMELIGRAKEETEV